MVPFKVLVAAGEKEAERWELGEGEGRGVSGNGWAVRSSMLWRLRGRVLVQLEGSALHRVRRSRMVERGKEREGETQREQERKRAREGGRAGEKERERERERERESTTGHVWKRLVITCGPCAWYVHAVFHARSQKRSGGELRGNCMSVLALQE